MSQPFRLTEIFYSLQGEGFWTGLPSIFIRFSGCNLNCSFCDTNHNPNIYLTISEIITKIKSFPAKHVILTGGEPTLQLTQECINMLHNEGYFLHLETNGVNRLELEGIDWLTVSPKLSGIGWQIRKGNELKVVFQNQDLTPYKESQFDYYFLQPCSMQNTHEAIQKVKENPLWRLSLQTHKLLNIP